MSDRSDSTPETAIVHRRQQDPAPHTVRPDADDEERSTVDTIRQRLVDFLPRVATGRSDSISAFIGSLAAEGIIARPHLANGMAVAPLGEWLAGYIGNEWPSNHSDSTFVATTLYRTYGFRQR